MGSRSWMAPKSRRLTSVCQNYAEICPPQLTSRKTLRPGRRGPRRICTQKKKTVGQQTFSTLDTLLNFLPLLLPLKATQGRKDVWRATTAALATRRIHHQRRTKKPQLVAEQQQQQQKSGRQIGGLLACTSLSKQKPQSEKKKKKSIEKEKVANLLVRVVKEESVACLLMSLVEPSIAKSVLPKPEGASERREPREKREREGRERGGIRWLTIGPSNASKIFFSYQQSEKP